MSTHDSDYPTQAWYSITHGRYGVRQLFDRSPPARGITSTFCRMNCHDQLQPSSRRSRHVLAGSWALRPGLEPASSALFPSPFPYRTAFPPGHTKVSISEFSLHSTRSSLCSRHPRTLALAVATPLSRRLFRDDNDMCATTRSKLWRSCCAVGFDSGWADVAPRSIVTLPCVGYCRRILKTYAACLTRKRCAVSNQGNIHIRNMLYMVDVPPSFSLADFFLNTCVHSAKFDSAVSPNQ